MLSPLTAAYGTASDHHVTGRRASITRRARRLEQADDETGRVAARGLARTVPVRRRTRAADHRPGEARADRGARDPTGVARRMDLAATRGKAPGDRSRRSRADAVPLPRQLPRATGAGEVRQADPLRRAAARPARGDGWAHGARHLRA